MRLSSGSPSERGMNSDQERDTNSESQSLQQEFQDQSQGVTNATSYNGNITAVSVGPTIDLSRLPPISPVLCPTISTNSPSGSNKEIRSNGWATFVGGKPPGDVPDPPPPPRVSTLRRDKKVTIVEEAVHRL